MARIKLVGTSLAALESAFTKSKDVDRIYWDTEVAGFGLRFRRGGNRSWILQYKIHGSDHRLTLGPYPGITAKVARALAQDKLAEVWKGTDPQQAKRDAKIKAQAQITLRAVIDNFLADRQPELRPATLTEMQRYLLKDWKSLHGWPIGEIQLKHVANILTQLKRTGPVSASRSRSCLSTCFRWAMGNGLVQQNPVIGTLNPDNSLPRKRRVLDDSELRKVWIACSDGPSDYGNIVKLLILTGCRRTEIGAMRWSELDFENRIWTIPSERTKNGEEHTLPLPDAFWNTIEGIERRPGIDQLFGYSLRGYRNWNVPKINLDERLAIPAWTHHDIRRTVATRMADIGVQPHIIEQVLNHTSGHKAGVAGIYNRSSYTREVKTALAIWADHVASIVSGNDRKVVPLRA